MGDERYELVALVFRLAEQQIPDELLDSFAPMIAFSGSSHHANSYICNCCVFNSNLCGSDKKTEKTPPAYPFTAPAVTPFVI
ncbi:MAG: hypothetical protein FWE14_04640 [Lachnospiraceae bacterium]|nr:hypothetical protein [Lachnospiraceae bacterium]